jgi:hypothetical protein
MTKQTYNQRAEELLRKAKTYLENSNDDKTILYNPKDLDSLIGSNGKIFNLNDGPHDNGYLHEIKYKEVIFQAITKEEYIPQIVNRLREIK